MRWSCSPPARSNYKWQARAAEGFDASNFQIDWENKCAICPAGCSSLSWTGAVDNRRNEVVKIKFSMRDCQPCASRMQCTRAKRRTITVREQDQYLALQAARERKTTAGMRSSIGSALALRGRSHRGYKHMACGGAGILVRPKHTSSM
jgi:transposase